MRLPQTGRDRRQCRAGCRLSGRRRRILLNGHLSIGFHSAASALPEVTNELSHLDEGVLAANDPQRPCPTWLILLPSEELVGSLPMNTGFKGR